MVGEECKSCQKCKKQGHWTYQCEIYNMSTLKKRRSSISSISSISSLSSLSSFGDNDSIASSISSSSDSITSNLGHFLKSRPAEVIEIDNCSKDSLTPQSTALESLFRNNSSYSGSSNADNKTFGESNSASENWNRKGKGRAEPINNERNYGKRQISLS